MNKEVKKPQKTQENANSNKRKVKSDDRPIRTRNWGMDGI